jgi:hypothetical protein
MKDIYKCIDKDAHEVNLEQNELYLGDNNDDQLVDIYTLYGEKLGTFCIERFEKHHRA